MTVQTAKLQDLTFALFEQPEIIWNSPTVGPGVTEPEPGGPGGPAGPGNPGGPTGPV